MHTPVINSNGRHISEKFPDCNIFLYLVFTISFDSQMENADGKSPGCNKIFLKLVLLVVL
jgi:hypothetical protein